MFFWFILSLNSLQGIRSPSLQGHYWKYIHLACITVLGAKQRWGLHTSNINQPNGWYQLLLLSWGHLAIQLFLAVVHFHYFTGLYNTIFSFIPIASSNAKRTAFPWSMSCLARFPIHLKPVSVSYSSEDEKKNTLRIKATFDRDRGHKTLYRKANKRI